MMRTMIKYMDYQHGNGCKFNPDCFSCTFDDCLRQDNGKMAKYIMTKWLVINPNNGKQFIVRASTEAKVRRNLPYKGRDYLIQEYQVSLQ